MESSKNLRISGPECYLTLSEHRSEEFLAAKTAHPRKRLLLRLHLLLLKKSAVIPKLFMLTHPNSSCFSIKTRVELKRLPDKQTIVSLMEATEPTNRQQRYMMTSNEKQSRPLCHHRFDLPIRRLYASLT
jgi:hypothetical protein